MSKNLWTEPQIKKGSPSYVWFRYFNEETGKYKLIVRKGTANAADLTKAETAAALAALCKAIRYKLKNQDWNPIKKTYKIEQDIQIDDLKEMTFRQAMNFAYEKKLPDWSLKSRQDYKSTKKYILQSAENLGFDFRNITELKRAHYLAILEDITLKRKLGAKGYNRFREHLCTFLSKVEEYEILDYNPILKIKTKETIKTFSHRPPTQAERLLIVNELKDNHPNYFRFVSVLYGTTLRPIEIAGLQIKDIDYLKQAFILMPIERKAGEDVQQEKTKTKIYREIAIPNWLMTTLSELRLGKYDKEFYIFGADFLPSKKRLSKNVSTTYWRNIVKNKKTGLGLDVDQYGLKKLSGDDMVELKMQEGVNDLLKIAQSQMGHTTEGMTRNYITKEKEIIAKVIREKMPELPFLRQTPLF
ncbi:tyrosine-type recombinase/integrase [Arachidicoccus sp.]|uniref:tyrosine-type recombinase/integrase n=1 Tax=Arachidicoccus sp. TaxID=1872624 RepID=UPI003D1E390D